jgi:hypothetical protein
MTWETSFSFIGIATLLVIAIAWLISLKILPIATDLNYKEAGLRFIQVWIWLAISIGIVLPGIAFLVWFDRPEYRNVFGFYLLVIIIQILTEQFTAKILFSSLVVPIGTVYTIFRLWQVWQGQQLIQSTTQDGLSYNLAIALLWLLFLFWSSNLIMLLTLGWSSIKLRDVR